MRLYEINEELERLMIKGCEIYENIEDYSHSEVTEVSDQLLLLEIDRREKLINYARMIKNLKADAVAIKAEKDKLAAREKSIKSSLEWLTAVLTSNIEPGEKIEDATCVISTRKSTRCEILCDPEQLPESYKVIKYEAMKSRIAKDLKDGATLRFAKLVDHYSVQIK